MRRFENKVAIVTGAGGYLGRATAQRLSDEGAVVVVADIDPNALAQTVGLLKGRSRSITFDAADELSIKELIDETLTDFGRIDVLNNNVGIVRQSDTTILDIDLWDWDRTFQINLRGYFLAIRFALPPMLEAGKGAIVNIASRAGLGGAGALVAYGVSKAAIIALSEYVAVQYGRRGIRCNTVCPGPIRTPAVERMAGGSMDPVRRATYVTEVGEPHHIAAAVAYLASDDSGFTNGELIRCDGGSTSALSPWLSNAGIAEAVKFNRAKAGRRQK